MKNFLKGSRGILCGIFILTTGAGAALAYGLDVGRLTYIFYQHSSTPSYDIARGAMKNTYKDVPSFENPLIGIAEADLNNDNLTEIISYPTEEYEEEGFYCKANNICPHYITQIRDTIVYNLGIIEAEVVDLGDDTKNGYWRLKAYPDRENKSVFRLYEYDRTRDVYVPSKQ